jgi:hypothetical protein
VEGDTVGSHDDLERLGRLRLEERELSARRRRLHTRLEFLRSNGNADGTPATPDQLAALDAEERKLSSARRALHRQIDELRTKD